MGRDSLPFYGEDFATDLEVTKKLLSKIENKTATENDLKEFLEVSAKIVEYASKN